MKLVSIKTVLARNHTLILAVLATCSIVGASQALSASAGTSSVPPNPSPFAAYLTPIATTLSVEEIVAIARSESARAGEPNPTISISKGSFENAMRSVDPSTIIPETSEPGEQAMFATPVSLVVMHGAFTLQNAHVRHGVKAPTGPVFDLIIDEHTGAVMGRALPSPADLAASLPLASTASTKAKDGIIVGTVGAGGGPARPGRRRIKALGTQTAVVVMSLKHVIFLTTMTDGKGLFSIRIRPGHYLVTSTFTNSCLTNRVVVRPGKIVSTHVSCSIK